MNDRSPNPAQRDDPRRSDAPGIDEREIEHVEERASPRTPVIFEIVSRLGEEEMARPAVSLWWSGIAAGLSISFSVLAQALLEMHLPDEPWRPLVSRLGYAVGFLMAVLSRQQLFTENTVTAILPVVGRPSWEGVRKLARLWAIVLAANLAGTALAALFCTVSPALPPEVYESMLSVSRRLAEETWPFMLFGGITAGFLMAAMVWMMPSAESAQFQVVAMMTTLIALGGFPHVVAGSIEAFLLLLHGDVGAGWLAAEFFVPVLAGNVIGGTALFGLIAYAQVMKEI